MGTLYADMHDGQRVKLAFWLKIVLFQRCNAADQETWLRLICFCESDVAICPIGDLSAFRKVDLTNEPGCFQLSAYNQPWLRHERGKRQFACLAQSMDRGAGNKIRWNDLRAFNISAFIDIGVGPHITCLHRVNSYLSFARVPGNPVRL